MDWKIEQEWIIMRYFKEYCHGFPKGKLVKGESPDFQLWISPKRFVGMELTQVHQYSSEGSAQCVLTYDSAIRQIFESIKLKEEKIDLYRSDNPYKLWLIIFADYSEPHALNKVSKEYGANRIDSSYDKVYFFDLDTHQIIELTI